METKLIASVIFAAASCIITATAYNQILNKKYIIWLIVLLGVVTVALDIFVEVPVKVALFVGIVTLNLCVFIGGIDAILAYFTNRTVGAVVSGLFVAFMTLGMFADLVIRKFSKALHDVMVFCSIPIMMASVHQEDIFRMPIVYQETSFADYPQDISRAWHNAIYFGIAGAVLLAVALMLHGRKTKHV